jgi:hypothetical protein
LNFDIAKVHLVVALREKDLAKRFDDTFTSCSDEQRVPVAARPRSHQQLPICNDTNKVRSMTILALLTEVTARLSHQTYIGDVKNS